MYNTCPIDNLLMAIHVILVNRPDIIQMLLASTGVYPVCQTLIDVHHLFVKGQWAKGKWIWITFLRKDKKRSRRLQVKKDLIDIHGTEQEYMVELVDVLQSHVVRSKCSKGACPRRNAVRQGKEIILK